MEDSRKDHNTVILLAVSTHCEELVYTSLQYLLHQLFKADLSDSRQYEREKEGAFEIQIYFFQADRKRWAADCDVITAIFM